MAYPIRHSFMHALKKKERHIRPLPCKSILMLSENQTQNRMADDKHQCQYDDEAADPDQNQFFQVRAAILQDRTNRVGALAVFVCEERELFRKLRAL